MYKAPSFGLGMKKDLKESIESVYNINNSINEEEQLIISLFEKFLEENFHVEMLTEEDLDYVFEEEFPQWLEEQRPGAAKPKTPPLPVRKTPPKTPPLPVRNPKNKIRERDNISSRTADLDPRMKNALRYAGKKTPEVKDMELTSKGNPVDFNTRQDLLPHKGDVIGSIKHSIKHIFKKQNPESQRYKNGKSAGQGAPFHDYGKSADVAITPKDRRNSDYAAAKFASAAQSQLIKQAKNKGEGPVIGFAVKQGEKSTPKHLSSPGYMKQPKNTPPEVQSIHIGYDNPGNPGTKHRDIRDKYVKRSNVYGPNRMVDPHSGTFALYQQQRTDAERIPRRPPKTPPLPVRNPKNKINENEYLPSLFELYVENNYYVERLSEANVLWIYEEEFPQWLEEKMNIMDILGGAGAGAATSAVIGLNPLVGAALGGISGAMADYPDAKKAAKKTVAKKTQTSCPPENKTTSEKQEEQQISPKMQAYINEMSKKGTTSIEHGGDGATFNSNN